MSIMPARILGFVSVVQMREKSCDLKSLRIEAGHYKNNREQTASMFPGY